jgi:hypothetical protein
LHIHRTEPLLLRDVDKVHWQYTPSGCNLQKMRVGLHTDVTVRRLPSPQPVIDQVFVSTGIQTSRKPSDLVQTCLNAAYEGAYLCAAERQSRKLVLTAVGGSFQNNTRQIAEAMLRAHESVGPSVRSSFRFTWPGRLR